MGGARFRIQIWFIVQLNVCCVGSLFRRIAQCWMVKWTSTSVPGKGKRSYASEEEGL